MLKHIIKIYKWWLLFYSLIGILIQYLSCYSIVLFQKIIDNSNLLSLNTNSVLNIIIKNIVFYGVVSAIICILNYLSDYPRTKLSNSIYEKIKIFSLEKISRILYSEYQKIGIGQTIKLIENGADAGRNIIFSFYLRLLAELIPTIIFSLIFIGIYNINVMLIILAGYIIVFIVTKLVLSYMYKIKSELLKKQENMSKISVRGLMELVIFRLNRRYKKEIETLNTNANEMVKMNCKLVMIHEFFFAFFAFLICIIKIIMLYIGVHNIINGNTTIGVIVASLAFIDKVYSPIAIFNVLYVQNKLNQVTYERFNDFYNKDDDQNLYKGKEINDINGCIKIRQLEFAYNDVNIIKNMSLDIEKGSRVAIVGESGGGKTTLIKLILGLLKKQSGEILIDDADINTISLDSFYNNISYTSQDAPIFDATVRENLIFDKQIDDDEIFRCLDVVLLKEKINSMENKLDALVGEKGGQLSGGEKQRLAIARVIIQNQNLVVIDEPFSALDAITEIKVVENIMCELKDKTMIIITHRLQSIKNVDKIVVLRNGEIINEGNFNYLINNCSYFVELWKKSQLEETQHVNN